MSEQDSGVSRRSVLKRTAATGVAGVATVGAASGSAVAQLPAPSQGETDTALAQAGGLFDLLASEGLVSGPAELPTGQSIEFGELAAGTPGRVALDGPNGREIRVGTETADGFLTVVVRPSSGDAFATLQNDNDAYFIDTDDGVRSVSATSIECDCLRLLCGDGDRSRECCDNSGDCIYDCCCGCPLY